MLRVNVGQMGGAVSQNDEHCAMARWHEHLWETVWSFGLPCRGCQKRCLGSCDTCHKALCSGCVRYCTFHKREECALCVKECYGCERTSCRLKFCELCGTGGMCSDHRVTCDSCHSTSCFECSVTCATCDKACCEDCNNGQNSHDMCQVECGVCEHSVDPDTLRLCDVCERDVCEDCLPTDRCISCIYKRRKV